MALALLFALALVQAGAPEAARPVRLVDNGFCAGISWITLAAGETVSADEGPDFIVFRVAGPGQAWWGVYAGNAASVSGQDGLTLAERDGVRIRRAHSEQGVAGYLAENRQGWQNHFFGSVFNQTEADIAFFDRVDFSPAARERCRAYWEAR